MVEEILSIIDRLIQLIGIRKERQQHGFNSLVTPVFQDMLLVHTDYLSMFEEVIRALDDRFHSVRDVASRLSERRVAFEPVREKLRTLSKALEATSASAKEPINTFLWAVSAYFPRGELLEDPTSATRIVALLEEWDATSPVITPYGQEIGNPRLHLKETVCETMGIHRMMWSSVCEAYAKLMVAVAKT